jgi:hypothetical protein
MVAGRTIRIGVGLAPVIRLPTEPSSTLTDNFDDNSRDTGLWNIGVLKSSGSGAVAINEANQRLEITPNTGAAGYTGYISVGSYDLTNNNIYCKVTETGAVAGGEEAYIGAGQDSNNYYLALISGTSLFLQRNAAGSAGNVGTVAYSGTTHAWLRLRFDGTTVYLDTATSSASNPPASGDWTNLFSEARNAAINLTSTKVAVVAGGFNASSSAAFQFDGFNTATTAVSNEISGTSALTFTPSATATGLGTLSGSSALTLTDSGTLTGLGTLAGSSTLTFADSGTATGLGSVVGSSSLLLSPTGTATGLGRLLGSSALTFAPSATATGLGALAGPSTLVFTPSGTATGLGSLTGSSALAFALAGTTTGIGTLTGSSSLTFANSATLIGLGSLLASTTLSFSLAGTIGLGAPNDIAGAIALSFVSSAALSGFGQMSGSTAFSLTLSGSVISGGTRFVVTPKPANANLTSVANPSETNVIGPARPAKVPVTTVSTASGTFAPAVKPARGQWRT